MAIEVVGIVVPAHNEAAVVRESALALVAAARRARIPVRIVFVDDSSTDGTALVAATALNDVPHAILQVRARNVGAARRVGHDHLLDHFSDVPRQNLWFASTDADTVVEPDWLVRQLHLAENGTDAVAGIVQLPAGAHAGHAFAAAYQAKIWGAIHGHIHGANMGVRASAYLLAGGFQAQECHEDVSLWQRLRANPRVTTLADSALTVTTSARQRGRLRGGFASHLFELANRSQARPAS